MSRLVYERNEMAQLAKKEHWGSQIGAVLAVAGSAVGLGNFLRFPGQVVNNGGGAFMIPYIISLLLIAIPISMSEWALGRCGGRKGFHSPLGVYHAVSGGKTFWGVLGGLNALAPFVINMYYIFVESWCLLYALQYLGGILQPLGLGFSFFSDVAPGLHLSTADNYNAFFGSLVGISENGSLFKFSSSPLLIATAVCAAANFLLIFLGVSRGIEKFSKFAAPLILICAVLVIVRIVTLDASTCGATHTFLEGLGFMWNPTREIVQASGEVARTNVWDSLLNPDTWLAATAQIFFSVSICLGSICTYASYVRPKDDIALSSLSATATNEFCEVVLAGFMTIPPAIMFLGMNAADKFGSSFSLGFVVLPNVFELMPFGQFFGFLFFVLLFLAAITSSMSLVQPTVALFQESFRWTRGTSVILAAIVNLVGTVIVCWYTKNLVALDVFDFWLANFMPFVFAIIQTTFIIFVWGVSNFKTELASGAKIKPPLFLVNVVKYASFPYLILIACFWAWKNIGARVREVANNEIAQLSLAFFAALIMLLTALSIIAINRWKRESANENALDAAEENQ